MKCLLLQEVDVEEKVQIEREDAKGAMPACSVAVKERGRTQERERKRPVVAALGIRNVPCRSRSGFNLPTR